MNLACICDAPDCGKRSEEREVWPSCRACKLDICPEHAVPGSARSGGNGEAIRSVYCLDCAMTWGPE